MKFKASIITALVVSTVAFTASSAGATAPEECTTGVVGETGDCEPAITGPATVGQPPVRSTPDDCFLFDGTRLAEGDYVLGQVDGVSVGTTARHIIPCAPTEADVYPPNIVIDTDVPTYQPPTVDMVLPETGAASGTIAAIAAVLLILGIGLLRTRDSRQDRPAP